MAREVNPRPDIRLHAIGINQCEGNMGTIRLQGDDRAAAPRPSIAEIKAAAQAIKRARNQAPVRVIQTRLGYVTVRRM